MLILRTGSVSHDLRALQGLNAREQRKRGESAAHAIRRFENVRTEFRLVQRLRYISFV